MDRRTRVPPLKFIESRPHRKTQAEMLAQEMYMTSFPHAMLANLYSQGLRIVVGDDEALMHAESDVAIQTERSIQPLDYVRQACLEITNDRVWVRVWSVRPESSYWEDYRCHPEMISFDMLAQCRYDEGDYQHLYDCMVISGTRSVKEIYRASVMALVQYMVKCMHRTVGQKELTWGSTPKQCTYECTDREGVDRVKYNQMLIEMVDYMQSTLQNGGDLVVQMMPGRIILPKINTTYQNPICESSP